MNRSAVAIQLAYTHVVQAEHPITTTLNTTLYLFTGDGATRAMPHSLMTTAEHAQISAILQQVASRMRAQVIEQPAAEPGGEVG